MHENVKRNLLDAIKQLEKHQNEIREEFLKELIPLDEIKDYISDSDAESQE